MDKQQLRELLEKATSAPWVPDLYSFDMIYGPEFVHVADMRGFGGSLPFKENAELICYLRNHASQLLEAAERADRLESDLGVARQQIPHEGDGACDHCGRVPSVDIPTRLCDECSDGVKRAEAAEAQRDMLEKALRRIADGYTGELEYETAATVAAEALKEAKNADQI